MMIMMVNINHDNNNHDDANVDENGDDFVDDDGCKHFDDEDSDDVSE